MKKVYVVFPETVEFVPVSLEEKSAIGDVDEAAKDLLLFLWQNVPDRVVRQTLELMGVWDHRFDEAAQELEEVTE